MMRSMYSGVSGLRNQQIKMDVIGNNIANVSTAGFKKSRVVFSDKLYQAMQGASAPTDERGGTNPKAVGLGVAIASVDQIHTPYTNQITNRLTDMAIDGDGYFIVKDGSGNTQFTRSGAFGFDTLNNLVTSNGAFVQGWLADKDGIIDSSPSKMTSINVNDYLTIPPKATTEMIMEGNLNSSTEIAEKVGGGAVGAADVPDENYTTTFSKDFYDTLGNKNIMNYRFFKTAPNEWACDMSIDPTFSGAITANAPPAVAAFATGTEVFRVSGITFNDMGELTLPAGGINITVDRTNTIAQQIAFNIDLSKVKQYNAKSNINVDWQDGCSSGELISRSVGTDGVMTGNYSNGQKRSMFQVAMASFKNPEGLIQMGSSLWAQSPNSGDPKIGVPGSGSRGAITPGSLEMSNVDLSEEFTEMIVTQRAFSANSRIITTSDEMLQELVNIKR